MRSLTHPRITVLMAVYNGSAFLRQAIDSILEQTFTDYELLIINDASTDDSGGIIASYHDPRIRVVNNRTNLGLTKSLNIGLKLAKGSLIARMDADDLSHPQRLAKQVALMETDNNYGLIASGMEVIDEKGAVTSVSKSDYTPEKIYSELQFRNCIPHSSVLFKKDLVLNLGGYNQKIKYAQDYALWVRLSQITKINAVNESLIKWRNTERNISNLRKREQQAIVKEIVTNNIRCLTGKNYPYEYIRFLGGYWHHLKDIPRREYPRLIGIMQEIIRGLLRKAPVFLDHTKLKLILAAKLDLIREKLAGK